MIPSPNAYFTAEEAKLRGAKPVWRFTIFPHQFPSGVAAGEGVFTDCAFVSPDRVQVDGAVSSANWESEILEVRSEEFPASATFTWDEELAGYSFALQYKTGATTAALAAASYANATNGQEYSLYQYYRFKFVWAAVRSQAVPAEIDEDSLTAYAVPAEADPLDSYAMPGSGGAAYVEGLGVAGSYVIAQDDVKERGDLYLEMSPDFDSIGNNDHVLTVFNLDGKFDFRDTDNFIFGSEDPRYNKFMRKEYGFQRPGSSIVDYTDPPLYEGVIADWIIGSPEQDSEGAPDRIPWAEIRSKSRIGQMMEQRVGMPLDAVPQPLTAGEFVMEANLLADANPFPPAKSANFETGDLSEVTVEETNGTVAISSTDPIKGDYESLCTITAQANALAANKLSLAANTQMIFATGWFKVRAMPNPPIHDNCTIFGFANAAGTNQVTVKIGDSTRLRLILATGEEESSSAFLESQQGRTRMTVGLIVGNPGLVKLWIGSDEVASRDDVNTSTFTPRSAWFGCKTSNDAETWQISWDDLKVWNVWYPCAYQVYGGPYEEVTGFFKDGRVLQRRVWKTVQKTKYKPLISIGGMEFGRTSYVKGVRTSSDNYVAYPQYGLAVWTDYANPPGGDVMLGVKKNTVWHPVDEIEAVLTEWGLDGYINSTSFAAAKAATPEYSVPMGYYFEDMSRADVIREICSRFLLSYYEEGGEIYLKAFTATPLTSPDLTITESMRKSWTIGRPPDTLVPVIRARAGWVDKNPDLQYEAIDQVLLDRLGDNDKTLDFSWGQPVMTEDYDLMKTLADRYLTRLQNYPEILTMSGWLELARLQLGDVVAMDDINYEITSKDVRSDENGVDLTGVRFLGVT